MLTGSTAAGILMYNTLKDGRKFGEPENSIKAHALLSTRNVTSIKFVTIGLIAFTPPTKMMH